MKRSSLAIAVAAILAASAALAQTPTRDGDPSTGTPTNPGSTDRGTQSPGTRTPATTNPGTANRGTTNPDTANRGNRTADNNSANRDDEKFLKDFAQANAAEVDAGKLAEQQAQNAEVKSFAKHMVEDHSKTIKKIETVATNLNIDVKAKPDLMHKAKSAMLDGKRGADFDEAYMKSQVNDHEKVVELLQKQAREGRDANVKRLASEALPEVQKHLDHARQLQAKVSNNARAGHSSRNDSSGSSATGTSNRDTSGASGTSGSTSRSSDPNSRAGTNRDSGSDTGRGSSGTSSSGTSGSGSSGSNPSNRDTTDR